MDARSDQIDIKNFNFVIRFEGFRQNSQSKFLLLRKIKSYLLQYERKYITSTEICCILLELTTLSAWGFS